MRDLEKEFMIKSMLGRKVKLDSNESIIEACISMAYRDMNTVGRFYNIKNRESIKEKLKNKILEKKECEFSRNLIDYVITEIFENKVKIIGNQNNSVTTFGLSQKLVNMTFKYLYLCRDYINKNGGISIDFSNCDCPIDSIILEKIGNNNYKWSKINSKQYKECQNIINIICDKLKEDSQNTEIGNLLYDFIVW